MDAIATRYGLWPFDERIAKSIHTHKAILLRLAVEEMDRPEDAIVKILGKYPEYFKRLVDILGTTIVNTLIMGNPHIDKTKKRQMNTIFADSKEKTGKIFMVDGQKYRMTNT